MLLKAFSPSQTDNQPVSQRTGNDTALPQPTSVMDVNHTEGFSQEEEPEKFLSQLFQCINLVFHLRSPKECSTLEITFSMHR